VSTVTLVAFDSPSFPLALRPRPVGLLAPTLSGGEHEGHKSMTAVYQAVNGRDDVYLGVGDRYLPQAPQPQIRQVTVAGTTGYLVLADDREPRRASLSWQHAPGQWVVLVGNGRFAGEAAVRALAATVVDEAQPVPLQVRLAPAGWRLLSYKDDRMLRIGDPGTGDEIAVSLVDRPSPAFERQVGQVRQARTVTVQGRDGRLLRTSHGWMLRMPLADGAGSGSAGS
jgi:hypothetical protein